MLVSPILFSSWLYSVYFHKKKKSIFVFQSSGTSSAMSFVVISQESKGIKPWCSLHPCAVKSLPDLFLLWDTLTPTGKSWSVVTICSFSLNVLSPPSLGPFSLPPHVIYSLPSRLGHLWAWNPAQGFATMSAGPPAQTHSNKMRGN